MKGKEKIEKFFNEFVKELIIRLDQETEQRKETLAYAYDVKRHIVETFYLTNEQEKLRMEFMDSLDKFVRSR